MSTISPVHGLGVNVSTGMFRQMLGHDRLSHACTSQGQRGVGESSSCFRDDR